MPNFFKMLVGIPCCLVSLAASAETDFYNLLCKTDQTDAKDLPLKVSIASGDATIHDVLGDRDLTVAMYENMFVWDVGAVRFSIDRFTGRLEKASLGPDGKAAKVLTVYHCEKIGGKRI